MQSMPIIDEAFSRIAMDMIGPLDRTNSGNKYILVVCDYATRYPAAIPLRNIDAETTSEAMVEVFTRYGIPREVLTDQGSNFMAELMQRVLELLQVSHIKTSPYHPQTDVLVERFNGTLKKMLNKFAQEHPKEWDKLIPYLLFAYREVPQESTGFSPFELLFGRHVRGPLDVLKESWETKHKVGDDVLTYVTEMREKLASMTELVQENLAKSQDRQKRWYDQKARSRSLEVGQRALVLLPSSNKKLHAAWQGPYVIKRKIGDVNYEVEMHDKKKRQRIFHINMLKPWNTPENVTYMSLLSGKELEGGNECFKNDEIQYPFEMDSEEPKVNPMLNDAQRCQLKNLMQEFKDVFNDIPGRTSLVEHKIDVGDAKPIRQRPCRIPWAQRDAVKRELEMMEHHGIIEESVSEWAQPVVIVPKKDSQEVCICVDFREVNKLAKVVPYPLPRVEDLIGKMAGAKYITTMDLSRGYWQIPLFEDSKEKTAFITPFGLGYAIRTYIDHAQSPLSELLFHTSQARIRTRYENLRCRCESSYSLRYKQSSLSLSSILYQNHHLVWGLIRGRLINYLKLLHGGLIKGGASRGFTLYTFIYKKQTFGFQLGYFANSSLKCFLYVS